MTKIEKSYKGGKDVAAGDLYMNYEINDEYKDAISFLAYLKGDAKGNDMKELKEKNEQFSREYLLDKYLEQYMDNVKKYYQSYYKHNTNRDYNDSDLNKEVEKFDKKRLNNIIDNYIDLFNGDLTKTKQGTVAKMTLTEYECAMNILADFNGMLTEAKKEQNIDKNNSSINLRQSLIREAKKFNVKTEIEKYGKSKNITEIEEHNNLHKSIMPLMNNDHLDAFMNNKNKMGNNNINMDNFNQDFGKMNLNNNHINIQKPANKLNEQTSKIKKVDYDIDEDPKESDIHDNLNINEFLNQRTTDMKNKKEQPKFKKIDVKKHDNMRRGTQIVNNINNIDNINNDHFNNDQNKTFVNKYNPKNMLKKVSKLDNPQTFVINKGHNIWKNNNGIGNQSMMDPNMTSKTKTEVKISKKSVNDKKNNINNQK